MTLVKVVNLFPPFSGASAPPVEPPPEPPPTGPALGYFILMDPSDPDNKRAQGRVG